MARLSTRSSVKALSVSCSTMARSFRAAFSMAPPSSIQTRRRQNPPQMPAPSPLMSLPDAHQISAPAGVIYTFKQAGDFLPMHTHGPDDVHVTCIMRGRFRIHGPVIADKEYEAGTFLDW